MAVLGLYCCMQASSSCGKWGLFLIAVDELLIEMASLVSEQALRVHRLRWLCCTGSVAAAHRLSRAASVAAAHRLSRAASVVAAHRLSRAASVAVAHRLSCSQHVGSSQIRDQTHVPCTS